MNIKTIFRGYSPKTKFKMVERIEDWPFRLFKGDNVIVQDCEYEVVSIVASKNQIIVGIKPFSEETDHFDESDFYRIEP